MDVGLYIHIPFCLERCHFCAFYLEVFQERKAEEFCRALHKEIRLQAAHLRQRNRKIDSIYFGGGTPTTLPVHDLIDILQEITCYFPMTSDVEVTVEAHPDTVNKAMLSALYASGVTRMSFGMQSGIEKELRTIGRHGKTGVPCEALRLAKRAGFPNINIDLMYGLPGQSKETWQKTLDQALELDPTHISCYALTIENSTRLKKNAHVSPSLFPDPTVQNNLEDLASEFLKSQGFQRYEISNYCRPGSACRHNQHYWLGAEYVGLGPSGQSYLEETRFGNVEDLTQYCEHLQKGTLPHEDIEWISPKAAHRDSVIFGLRLIDGIDSQNVFDQTDMIWNHKIRNLIARGLLERCSNKIRLTRQGRQYADSIALELM